MDAKARLSVFLSVILISALPSLCHAREGELQDVVYLKDGSVVRGVIIEQIPEESLTIRTATGSVVVFQMGEIERTAKERPPSTVPTSPRKSRKDPIVAGVFSFFLPGAGQFYNGEIAKGAVMLGVAVTGIALLMRGAWRQTWYDEGESETGIGGLLLFGAWIVSVIDAPLSASRINRKNGWTSLPVFDDGLALSLVDFSINGKTTPGVAFTWSF